VLRHKPKLELADERRPLCLGRGQCLLPRLGLDRAEQYGEQNRTPACPAIRPARMNLRQFSILAASSSTHDLVAMVAVVHGWPTQSEEAKPAAEMARSRHCVSAAALQFSQQKPFSSRSA
jgi:hypothetical protein